MLRTVYQQCNIAHLWRQSSLQVKKTFLETDIIYYGVKRMVPQKRMKLLFLTLKNEATQK
jgi:hypothetical protein